MCGGAETPIPILILHQDEKRINGVDLVFDGGKFPTPGNNPHSFQSFERPLELVCIIYSIFLIKKTVSYNKNRSSSDRMKNDPNPRH